MVFLSWFDIKRLLETLITKLFYIKKKKKNIMKTMISLYNYSYF